MSSHLTLLSPDWASFEPILRCFDADLARRLGRAQKLGPVELSREEISHLSKAINHWGQMRVSLTAAGE